MLTEGQQISQIGEKRSRSQVEQEQDHQIMNTLLPPAQTEPVIDNNVEPISNWGYKTTENESTRANQDDDDERDKSPFDEELWKLQIPADPRQHTEGGYFGSYSTLSIHDMMLKDEIRTLAYQHALSESTVNDKVVLDVGCGTGILSLFAARSGAKKVYGVDLAEIIYFARSIVEANNYSHKVTIFKKLAEDLTQDDIPEQIDILVSEWMGYGLLYEGMFESIIDAREKFKPKQMIPSSCSIFVSAFSSPESHFDNFKFWDNVYGFKMPAMKEGKLIDADIHAVEPTQCEFSSRKRVYNLDCMTATKKDLSFLSRFSLFLTNRDQSNVISNNAQMTISGIVMYFDCELVPGITLSTAPEYATHWKQVRLYLKNEIQFQAGDTLEGRISVNPDEYNFRDLNIVMSVRLLRNGSIVRLNNSEEMKDDKNYWEEERMYKIRS